MRLIDADFVYELHGNYPTFARSCADLTDLRDILDDAPTIDPESLRPQGEWLVQDIGRTKFSCSHCKARNYAGHENYCPNCGAKMKGGTP